MIVWRWQRLGHPLHNHRRATRNQRAPSRSASIRAQKSLKIARRACRALPAAFQILLFLIVICALTLSTLSGVTFDRSAADHANLKSSFSIAGAVGGPPGGIWYKFWIVTVIAALNCALGAIGRAYWL